MIEDDDVVDDDDATSGNAAGISKPTGRVDKTAGHPRWVVGVVVVVLALVVIGGAAIALRRGSSSDAATVNGVAISRNTIDQELADISVNKQFVQEVDQQGAPGPVAGTKPGTYNAAFVAALLDQQVRYAVISQVLAGKKALPTAADVASAKNEVSQSFPSGVFAAFPARYQAILEEQQAEAGSFVATETANLTTAALNQYYQAHLNDYATEACVRHILIADLNASGQIDYQASLAGAQKVKALLDAGGDFTVLAKQYSQDNTGTDGGTAAHGGTLTGSAPDGCLTGSDLQTLDSSLPAFAQAVVTLPVNVVSAPVQTDLGYHLIEVTSRVIEPLDSSVTADIHQSLAGDQLNTLLAKAKVKINAEYGSYDSKPDSTGQVTGVVPPSTVAPSPRG